MRETSDTSQTLETLELFNQATSQTLNSSAEDFRVRLFRLLESDLDSQQKTLEVLSFLKSVGFLEINESRMYSLKTSKDCSTTTGEEPLLSSSEVLLNWGTTFNGKLLTAKISESRRIGRGYSLSDILEENPDPKYFLSDDALQRMFKRKIKKTQAKEETQDLRQATLF